MNTLTAHILCLLHSDTYFWCAVTLVCISVDALGVNWGAGELIRCELRPEEFLCRTLLHPNTGAEHCRTLVPEPGQCTRSWCGRDGLDVASQLSSRCASETFDVDMDTTKILCKKITAYLFIIGETSHIFAFAQEAIITEPRVCAEGFRLDALCVASLSHASPTESPRC